jgi:two-component system sensor histidine kinase VicK
LLSNAVNYSPPRTAVTIKIEKNEKNFLLTVSDQGIGIPKADQSKIFTKLFRSGNAQLFKTDGTGLGLYITKLILDAIDGKIWFESNTKEQGLPAGKQGTTFYVTIPLKGMKAKEGSKTVEAITSLHKYK